MTNSHAYLAPLPVSLWDEKNAPVQGKRFRRYVEIAQQTEKLLMGYENVISVT
ncbi:MAG: hypothetical protein UHS32_11925 [Bacteroidaceae bacterium]|nr:hypothetical protein [Bacteroidaceae bacterium]